MPGASLKDDASAAVLYFTVGFVHHSAGHYFRWWENSRRLSKSGFRTREEAERFLIIKQGQIASGQLTQPDPRKGPRIGELRGAFLQARKVAHRVGKDDEGRWNNHVGPWFDRLRPGEVNVSEIRRYVESRRAVGANPGTVRIEVALLSSFYQFMR